MTAGPRLESLNKVLSAIYEKITVAEEMVLKIFTGFVMHSYQDVDHRFIGKTSDLVDLKMSPKDRLHLWKNRLYTVQARYTIWLKGDLPRGILPKIC